MLIRLGHSPDPDDAFMFWGLASGEVDPRRFEFEHVLRDIQTLNKWALEGKLEVTAISLAAYPLVQEQLRAAAARRLDGLGLRADRGRARGAVDLADAARRRDRRPGRADDRVPRAADVPRRASATARCRSTRSSTRSSRAAPTPGLLIHEGQLTYEAEGLKKVVDLGEWWLLETGLPLPLGANVARRDLGAENLFELSDVLRDSIQAGLDNREEAMEYALQFGRGLDTELADRFVGMYVNELTCDYGDEGRQAVRELMRRAEGARHLRPPRQGRVRRLSETRPVRLPAALDGGAHGGAGGRAAPAGSRRQR